MTAHPVMAMYRGLDAKRNRPAVFDGEITLTHGELIAHVEAVAAGLAADGFHGRRIGLCAANSWRHVVAYLAIMRAGCVWVPLNPRNGARLNADLQARAGLSLTLCDAASRDALGGVAEELKARLDRGGDVARLTDPPSDAGAAFAIKFTGGSTGRPKGVVQSLACGAHAMAALEAFYGFTANDVNLAVAPLSHGSSHYVIPVLAAGGAQVVMAQPDRQAILQELKARVSLAFMPPTLIHLLMSEAAFAPADFPALRHITYSAAPMAPAAIEKAIARFGPVLSTVYGQTEAPMTITGMSPHELAKPELRASVGRAFAGTPVAVLAQSGEIETRDAEGEVLVRGPLADTVYLDDPAQTAASRHDGWLKTGDLGRIDAQGYLFLLGRSKEMIISGGYNIYPAEIERALAEHPAVREACAFGVADDVWGERLEVAVAADGAGDEELRRFVRDALGAIRTPKRIHMVAALPRNPVGKVVRSDVRDLLYKQETSPTGEPT